MKPLRLYHKQFKTIIPLIITIGLSLGYPVPPSEGDASQSFTSPSAAPVWSPAMEDTISRLSRRLKEQQSEKNRLVKESDTLAARILKEKRKSGMSSSRKLDSMLRDSQQLVADLESISKQIKETESQLRQHYSLAVTALVRRLEQKSREEPLGEKERKNLLKHLVRYVHESKMLEEPIELAVPKVNLEVQDNDTPLQIKEKADFLSEQATLLKARIFQIEAAIHKLEREKALCEKVRKFTDEMSFFDDTLLVKERKMMDIPDGDPEKLVGGDIPGEMPLFSVHLFPANRREAFNSSPSDFIISDNGIDEQVELLTEQKSQLANQIQHLLQKTKRFYQRAHELGQSENH
ncbi:MAG: hypothetical protein ACMUIA_09900 [bacterium]